MEVMVVVPATGGRVAVVHLWNQRWPSRECLMRLTRLQLECSEKSCSMEFPADHFASIRSALADLEHCRSWDLWDRKLYGSFPKGEGCPRRAHGSELPP
jgi:hypothetical protein